MNEIKITIPEGYVGIDEKKSNLAEGKIVFKKKDIPWRDKHNAMYGYFISNDSIIRRVQEPCCCFSDDKCDHNVFATERQAKSMLAMAQLSQIIANDERFGGPITEEEWENETLPKHVIVRSSSELRRDFFYKHYHFLSFHTSAQRDLFLKENEDLIRQYFMLD